MTTMMTRFILIIFTHILPVYNSSHNFTHASQTY